MAMTTLQIFAFLLTVSSALALTCYKCDSSESALCNYGIGSFTYDTEDCNAGTLGGLVPRQCVKLVTKDKDGKEYVARGCMPGIGSGACNAIAKTLGFFSSINNEGQDISCSMCDTDKCNSASKYTAYSMLGILFACLAFLF